MTVFQAEVALVTEPARLQVAQKNTSIVTHDRQIIQSERERERARARVLFDNLHLQKNNRERVVNMHVPIAII